MYLEYYETTAEDSMEHCNWDSLLKAKMREPVAENGLRSFKPAQARMMVEIAWYDNPRRPVEVVVWDEAAKAKMRAPVRTNGYHHLDPEELAGKLFLFGSLY